MTVVKDIVEPDEYNKYNYKGFWDAREIYGTVGAIMEIIKHVRHICETNKFDHNSTSDDDDDVIEEGHAIVVMLVKIQEDNIHVWNVIEEVIQIIRLKWMGGNRSYINICTKSMDFKKINSSIMKISYDLLRIAYGEGFAGCITY